MGALAFYIIFFIVPSLIGIGYSFTDWSSYSTGLHFVGLANFREIFSPERDYTDYIVNTLWFTIAETTFKTVFALGLAVLLSIAEIDALHWTSGDTGPDGTYPEWDMIYEKSLKAGKSIWVKVYSGEFEDWIRNADRIVQKFGSHSLFMHFSEMSYEQGQELIRYADEHWSDVKGSIFA